MITGKCKKCGDTYIGDDYGPLKECSCNKFKEEKQILTADEVITQLKSMKWFEMGYDKGIKEERKRVIEQVREMIKEVTCYSLEETERFYVPRVNLDAILTKLERGDV